MLSSFFSHAFTLLLFVYIVSIRGSVRVLVVVVLHICILLQHETARALDNKWFRRSISDRDRFSTWQHISDDRLVPGVGARAG